MSVYQENFFTRGPSPLARLTFFSLFAIGVMVADHRFQALGWVRSVVSAVIAPVESALGLPGDLLRRSGDYLNSQTQLVEENRRLRNEVLDLAAARHQATVLKTEQAQLTAMKGAAERFADKGLIAEIVRDARSPFARKVIIDRGSRDGIVPGRAVIDGLGVVGQVTSVGLFTSEVTLTIEKDHPVPVMVVRNGLRAVAVGAGRPGTIEVPFIPLGADIQPGDELVTSGIDGTYPAGLAVATISLVDKNPASSFARIIATPVASPVSHRLVKVMDHDEQRGYPKSDVPAEENKPTKPGKPGKRVVPGERK